MAESDVIIPAGNVALLTDKTRRAGVLATSTADFGTILSRGATRLLEEQWFGGENKLVAVGGLKSPAAKRILAQASVPFERRARSSVALSVTTKKPAIKDVSDRRLTKREQIDVPGIRKFSVGKGRLRVRRIGNRTVFFHVSSEPIPGVFPLIDEPIFIDGRIAELGPEMMLKQVELMSGNNCAICAACALCTACGEVNAAVGVTGVVGVIGLAGNLVAPGPGGPID